MLTNVPHQWLAVKLLYFVLTRPDITHAMSIFSQFVRSFKHPYAGYEEDYSVPQFKYR